MRIVSCPEFIANVSKKVDPYRENIHRGELIALASPIRILGENVEAVLHVTEDSKGKSLAFDIYSEGYVCKTVHGMLHTAASVVFGIPMAIFKAGQTALNTPVTATNATINKETAQQPVTEVAKPVDIEVANASQKPQERPSEPSVEEMARHMQAILAAAMPQQAVAVQN